MKLCEKKFKNGIRLEMTGCQSLQLYVDILFYTCIRIRANERKTAH